MKPTLRSKSESVCRVCMLNVDMMPDGRVRIDDTALESYGIGMRSSVAKACNSRAVYDCAQERIH